MHVITTIAALRQWRATLDRPLVLVPTMGNLHDGHLKLVDEAAKPRPETGGKRPIVAASIFVNPLQFGVNEDLDAYPRTPREDLAALEQHGASAVFMPAVDEVYPPGQDFGTRVLPGPLAALFCGAARPGHFDGVLTVVSKLFHLFEPEAAIFGQKDYQQLALIRGMVNDLNMPVKLVGVATVRAADGLALSSRNGYLSVAERAIAPGLAGTLRDTVAALQHAAERADPAQSALPDLIAVAERRGQEALRTLGFQPDYLNIRQADSLAPADPDSVRLVALAAGRLGTTRLIDNLEFELNR